MPRMCGRVSMKRCKSRRIDVEVTCRELIASSSAGIAGAASKTSVADGFGGSGTSSTFSQ